MNSFLRPTAVGLLALFCACEGPQVARDGTVVFPEHGAHGATIVTANGVEFRDRTDIPSRIVHHSTSEPWKAPIGFILPRSGRFTATSKPALLSIPGLTFAVRPSDTRVPSWGGEVLVRIDIIAPAPEGSARQGEDIVVLLDGDGHDVLTLGDEALAQLGAYDKIGVVDVAGAKVVVPMLPGNHRSLASAAIEKRVLATGRPARDLMASLRTAGTLLSGTNKTRRLLVLTDGHSHMGDGEMQAVADLGSAGIIVSSVPSEAGVDPMYIASIATAGGVARSANALEPRIAMVHDAVPFAGVVAFHDTRVSFAGNPAPSHVLESSGGGVLWHLDSGDLLLGDVRAGEARTEVVRVTLPAFVAGHSFTLEVTAHATDATGTERVFRAEIPATYDDDIERIANSRNGDVIAYASALATLKRLDAAFVGDDVARAGGILAVARMHAMSMTLLARDTGDHAIAEQAEILNSLLAATQ